MVKGVAVTTSALGMAFPLVGISLLLVLALDLLVFAKTLL